MNTELEKKLLYRRQFLLVQGEMNYFDHWKKLELTNTYFLYVHPDLPYNEIRKQNKQLILLGDLFDPGIIGKGNEELAIELIKADSIHELTNMVYSLSGRYAIIFINGGNTYLLNDPCASRKIYYTINRKANWCGSQPHVLAKYLNIEKSMRDEVLHYYDSPEFHRGFKYNISNNTAYENIKQLLPNHYLDLGTGKHIRFWPKKPLQYVSLSEGIEKASEIITRTVECFSKRYRLMLPVTSGNDSRVILAASKAIAGDMYFYINKHPGMPEDHRDIRASRLLLNKMGLKSNIHEYSNTVDPDFKEIYNINTTFPIKGNMGIIYNIYYKQFQHMVNLPGGFSDISRNFYTTYKKLINPELLTKIYIMNRKYNVIEEKYFTDNFGIWLNEIRGPADVYGYNLLDLFNWEERHGNWATAFQEDKDIAQEELLAFSNRMYMDICLGVNRKFRDLDGNILYRSMVKHMWPEALSVPMYPKSWIKLYMKKFRIYMPLRRLLKDY